MTSDLVAWLREQLDEDERNLTDLAEWARNGIDSVAGRDVLEYVDRVPAEVDAKRRIMAIHRRRADVTGDPGGPFDNCCNGCGFGGYCDDPNVEDINACPELRALAAVYADRPGYRQEWAP